MYLIKNLPGPLLVFLGAISFILVFILLVCLINYINKRFYNNKELDKFLTEENIFIITNN